MGAPPITGQTTVEAPPSTEIRAHWLNWAFFAACFAVASGWLGCFAVGAIPSDHVHTAADRVFTLCLAFALALFAAWLAWQVHLRRGMVVRLTPIGLTDTRIAKCEIPWLEVTGCSLVDDRNTKAVRVWLTPEFASVRFEASARPMYRLRRFLGETGALVSARGLRGTNLRRLGRTIAQFMKAYGRPVPTLAVPDGDAVAHSRAAGDPDLPFATLILCMMLSVAYMGEIGSIGLKPDAEALLSFGALARPNLLAGEWWRLATAPMLHLSPSHLICNLIALFIIGRVLEPLVGSGRFLIAFTVCALAGGFASAFLSMQVVVSVGASGGTMGLLAAAVVMAFRSSPSTWRGRLLSASVPIILPTLLASFGSKGATVDMMAHLGGLLAGAALGAGFSSTGRGRPEPSA